MRGRREREREKREEEGRREGETKLRRDSFLLCHIINLKSFKHQSCLISLELFQNNNQRRHIWVRAFLREKVLQEWGSRGGRGTQQERRGPREPAGCWLAQSGPITLDFFSSYSLVVQGGINAGGKGGGAGEEPYRASIYLPTNRK